MRPRALSVAVFSVALGLAGPVAAAEEKKTEAAQEQKAEQTKPSAPAYVGDDDLCSACHAEQAESYGKTPHAAALSAKGRTGADRGCEACHGPAQEHVDKGGGKGVGNLATFADSVPATERSAVCLRCHGSNKELFGFRSGAHALADVACTDCHDPHWGVGPTMLKVTGPRENPVRGPVWGVSGLQSNLQALCYRCHLEVRSSFALTEHHKVPEGVLTCLDCHQPHGSRNPSLLRGANDRTCFKCHGGIEGPFVFEHVGLVTEGCVSCHVPHGSANRHLLKYQQVAQLCYECHTVTPANHIQPSYRDCTRCHVAIHGSNTNPRFLEQ